MSVEVAFDVVVVGGGPAGSAAALALRNAGGLSVAVVERGDHGAGRGVESLSPGAEALLDYLKVQDIGQDEGHIPAFGTRAVWGGTTAATYDLLMTPFGNGLRVDRRRFDRRLFEIAAERGAAAWPSSRARKVERRGDGWLLEVDRPGETLQVHGRFLIDATGKRCWIARRFGGERRFLDRQVAAVANVVFGGAVPEDTPTLIEACDIGWWYSARTGPGAMGVGLMTDADLARSHRVADPVAWAALARAMPYTSQRLWRAVRIGAPKIVAACSGCLTRVVGDGWVAVGDAAGSCDPLSTSGIARSLDSAIRAARAVRRALLHGQYEGLDEYDARMSGSFDQYCLARAHHYQMEQRWPESPFWRRRQGRLTLSPQTRLVQVPMSVRRRAAPKLPADLRHVDAAVLCAACERPRPAHEAVSYYRMRAAEPASDMEVILALQWLLSDGALEAAPPAPAVNEAQRSPGDTSRSAGETARSAGAAVART